jgi:hypothetical protein
MFTVRIIQNPYVQNVSYLILKRLVHKGFLVSNKLVEKGEGFCCFMVVLDGESDFYGMWMLGSII